MTRYLMAALTGLLIVISATAADAKKLVLRWYGHSFFQLTTSAGTQVVFDPHTIEAYGRATTKGDVICISHYHNDHTQIGMVENRDKAKLLVGLKGSGKKIEWNEIDEKVKDVRIRTVGVYHDGTQGMERGKNAIFIVEADGLRIVHLGDLGHALTPELVKQIGPVDVLMIPVGGVYTINGSEAKKVVEQLKPKMYILPMHFGVPKVFEDVLTVDEFLEDQKRENIKRYPLTNELTIANDFKPAEPVIALLNFKVEPIKPPGK